MSAQVVLLATKSFRLPQYSVNVNSYSRYRRTCIEQAWPKRILDLEVTNSCVAVLRHTTEYIIGLRHGTWTSCSRDSNVV